MTSATPKPRAGEHDDVWAASRCPSCGQQMRGTDWTDRILNESDTLRRKESQTQKLWEESTARNSKLEAERDLLRERERGLVEALAGAVRFIVRTAAHKGNMDAATLAKEEVRIMEHTSQLCSGRWTGDMVSFDLAAARALLAKHGR